MASRPASERVEPEWSEAHVQALARGAHLLEMRLQFLLGLMQGFQRRARKFKLPRRFE